MDVNKFSNMANESRAAGDTKAADLYEQIVTLSAAGAVPLMGMGARVGRRATINAAEEAIKKGALGDAAKMLEEIKAIDAWHGSPHKFKKFRSDKIGTGEGAQMYGSGIYLADASDVAKTYQPRSFEAEELMMDKYKAAERAEDYETMEIWESAMMHETPAEIIKRYSSSDYPDSMRQKAAKVAEELKEMPTEGGLYNVALGTTAENLLDWDAPLSKQSEAIQNFAAEEFTRELGMPRNHENWDGTVALNKEQLDSRTGATLYNSVTNRLFREGDYSSDEQAKAAASSYLNEIAEIDGIRYLDQASRDAGEGTRNYVVFDENLITIKPDDFATESAKMLDEVDAVNAPRLELPETGRPVRASEYGADEFKAITRNMYKHQADVSTPAEMVARAERIEPGFQTAIRNITDDLGLVKSETFGVKQVKSLENKLKRGYELGSVTDPIRTRILINTVQEADEVVNRIADMMPVQDRGFQQHTTSGYFDRKLNVMYTDPNGERLLGEIQITTPEMLEAVDGKGHRLYEVERALTERYGAEVPTTHIRRFENMQRAQKELYQGVAEKVDPRIVESIEVKPDKDFVSTPPTTQRPVTEAQREAWREANKGDFRQEQTPELSLAAEKLGRGEITIADYAKEVKRLRPIEPLTSVPKISSFEEIASALDKNKVDKGIIGLDKEIVDGTPVGSRLDIPAYNNYDTWVVSVHEGTGVSGKSLGYGKVAVLDNVSFNSNPNAAYGVATGSKDKAPFARMNGEWRNVDPEVARKQAEEYLTNPDWVQVGMNPYRHSFFYDKATGQPLASADEVIQIGPLVLARNSKTRPLESPEHAIKNPKEGQPKYFKKGGSIERVYKEQTYI